MSNRKKIKPTQSELNAKNYVLVGDWIIDARTLETKMFLVVVNRKTNMQFSVYCSDGLAVLYKHSPQELEHRLNVIGGLVDTVLLTDDLSGVLKMFAPANEPLTGTEEESQEIIAKMKREHILGKVLESTDEELEEMVESGEVNVNELTKGVADE